MEPSRTNLGVVILDLDQRELTTRCLDSLASGNCLPQHVVLVENGDYGFTDLPKTHAPLHIHRIHPGRNLGCAGGRNAGISYLLRSTRASCIVVLDNDTVVPPDFVEWVVSLTLGGNVAYAPAIMNLRTNEPWSFGGSIAEDGFIRQIRTPVNASGTSYEVDWAPGACLIFSRTTWGLVGHFDEWINFFFEDIDWCHRLRQKGGRVILVPVMKILHEPSQSMGGEWSPVRTRYWARNGTVFRLCILRRGPASYVKWFGGELRDLLRDSLRMRPVWVVFRLVGIVEGVVESIRRRALAPA